MRVIRTSTPVPPSRPRYPFRDLGVGDSFAVDRITDTADFRRVQKMLAAIATRHRPKRFRTEIDRERKRVSVWRIK